MNTAEPTTLVAPANPDLHIVKHEVYDPEVMDALLRDTESFSKRDLGNLGRYKRGREHGNRVKVIYHYGRGCEELKIGRLYVRDGQGLQAFPFDIRNPLLAKHYWDIDMENAHYCLMRQLCDNYSLKNDAIGYYCDNREECLKAVSSNRSIAKVAFLKVAYGGNIKLANEHYNDEGISPDGDISLLKKIENEIEVIIAVLKRKNPDIYKIAEKKTKKGKDGNTDFTFLALCLQTEECKCLMAMDEYFRSVNRSVDILIHDGCEVRKLDGEKFFPTELLRGAEEHIKRKTGYTMRVVEKPIKHNLTIPDTPKDVVDDAYASKVFVGLMGDFIQREGEEVYYFDETTGMWDKGDTPFRVAVSKHKHKLIFNDGERTHNYGGMEKNVMAMKKWILPTLADTKFITRNADSSYGKLLFADGIYDFQTNNFSKGFNPKIVFNKRIDRNFPSDRNEELIETIRQTLFENAFDDETGQLAGVYLRKALCVSLLGDYRRKKFYFGLGESNCGKGVMTDAFKSSFGGYVASFCPNQLKYNSRNGQDEARKLSWVKDLIGSRIAFGNELRMDSVALDGNLLKAVSSGGDEMKGRNHQEGESTFVNRATMFLLANDMLPITPKDSGIQERARFIRYKLRFVLNPSSPDERLADPQIKEKFNRDDWKDALFYVMVDTYNDMTETERKLGGVLHEPECVREETREWVGDDGTAEFATVVGRRYEITGDPEHQTPTEEICEYIITERKMKLSPNKVGRMLTKLVQAINKDCPNDKNVRGVKHRLGIRRFGLGDNPTIE
jgi:hypothetical protein